MTLIHTALQSEAQSIIEKYKLKLLLNYNLKIYSNDKVVLLISGMGKVKTLESLEIVFAKFKIQKAINIGISGCSDKNIAIGSLFCTNQKLTDIKHIALKTVDTPQTAKKIKSLLFDMEGKYFEEYALRFLDKRDIYIFKVVSDYLDDTIPSKEFVKQLINKNIKSIEKWI